MKKEVEDKNIDEKKKESIDGEEETEEKSCAKKSEDLTTDDLEKSIAKLSEYHEKGDTPTRKKSLLEKAQEGELTKSEQDELHQILGGGEAAPVDTLSDNIQKAMEPTDDLQKAMDVSRYLHDQHDETIRVNTALAKAIEASDNRQQEYNLLEARTLAVMGKLLKSIDGRVSEMEGQPARSPKSQHPKALQKSFAGAPPDEDQMTKSEIQSVMNTLIEKSADAGNAGVVEGINMPLESAKYETTGFVSPAALSVIKKNRSAVH